jgi:L-methionine (R)-S-oxide reductase
MSDIRSPDYALINKQLVALNHGESDALAITANSVALIYDNLPDINWCGVYVLREKELVLGPFQGKPACVRIPIGRGVCGTAAARRETLRVPDVDSFAGHIACDSKSRSELVVPLLAGERLLGVLDLDSPVAGRFSAADQAGIELLCASFITSLGAGNGAFI